MTEPVSDDVSRAAKLLRAGDLVAFPTETVYGLGADAWNETALAKIFAAKSRPADHPLIVHIADAAQLGAWARDIPEAALKLARAFWPGPLTVILKKQPQVHDLVTGGQDTVGLRVPNHPLALQLLHAFGSSIAAPSANRFGRISPTTASHVRDELGDAVSLVLDGGPCDVGIESTIVDLSRGEALILRPGMIGAEAITRVLGSHVVQQWNDAGQSAPRVSGTLESHYAPNTTMKLVPAQLLIAEVERLLLTGQSIAVLSAQTQSMHRRLHWQQASSEAVLYAHDLYANLRLLDQVGASIILVEVPPMTDQWLAISDRLQRAAKK